MLVFLMTTTFSGLLSQDAITCQRWKGGRFGDQIISYSKAKLLSFKYDLLFLYKPFEHSNKLEMHQKETHYSQKTAAQCDRTVNIQNECNINPKSLENILYTSPYHLALTGSNIFVNNKTENSAEHLCHYTLLNPSFAHELKKMISPTIQLPKPSLPPDKICVAVHVRKGSNTDRPLGSIQQYSGHENLVTYNFQSYPLVKIRSNHFNKKRPPHNHADKTWPQKFPPDQYYIDQIKKLSAMFHDAPLYVYLFTDHHNPHTILARMF